MTCVYCRFPIEVGRTPESRELSASPVQLYYNRQVECKHCGAQYSVKVFVERAPNISDKRLKEIRNKNT